jgi:hypothetical protein
MVNLMDKNVSRGIDGYDRENIYDEEPKGTKLNFYGA